MLFIYIHTHPVEKCMEDKPQEVAQMVSKLREEMQKAGVKPIGTYVAPHEHTVFSIFEAGDFVALEKALSPMTLWGNARLIPIMPVEQLFKQ